MKQKLWITLATCLAYCIDKKLYQAIDYLREQVRVLVEHQEKQDKRIRLINSQRIPFPSNKSHQPISRTRKSPFPRAEKHHNFQVTSCHHFVTTNPNFAYIESE